MTGIKIQGGSIIQYHKLWDYVLFEYCQSLSTNNDWPNYKDLNEHNYYLSCFILPPLTHINFIISKEKDLSFYHYL